MFWAFTEISNFYGGRSQKSKSNIEGGLPKKGDLDSLQIEGGPWQEIGGGVFERGDTPIHTMTIRFN